jgi:hypothetical protein
VGKLRKIILLVFAVIYLVVAPLTVLYALGYIFSPTQQTLLQTGLITLSSEPDRANVSVNGLLVKDRTPLILRNLKPASHDLLVEAEGRHPWHRRVEVKADQALRLENILLFPLSLEPEILGNFPVAKLWHVSRGKHLVALEKEKVPGLWLFKLEERSFESITLDARYEKSRVKEVTLHPAGDEAVVILQRGETAQPLLVQFKDPIHTMSLSDLLPHPFTQLASSLHHKSSFFYLKDGTLRRFDFDRFVLYPVLAKGVRGYAVPKRNPLVLDENGRFLELEENGRVRTRLLEDPVKAHRIFSPKLEESYSVFFLNDNLAIFLSKSGKLFSNKLPYLLEEGVDELALAVSRPRLAYRKGNELWLVDFQSERKQAFFENGPVIRKIYKGEDRPASFRWFYNDQYLLFEEGNRLKVVDFEGGEDAIDLLPISKECHEFALDSRGFLYFAHPEGERLARVKLFERERLLPE